MSAAPVGLLAPEHPRLPARAPRPQLRLVASQGQLKPHERALRQAIPARRVTRQGRLVITLMVAVAVLSLAMMLATSVDAAAPQIDHSTTVLAGQTLSEVAAAQLPGLPNHNAVALIQLANDLSSPQVHAGQSLRIPVVK